MIEYRTCAGDTVDGILYRETGRNDDEAEREFWRLNPHAAEKGPLFPAGITLLLPVLPTVTETEVLRPWD